MSKIAESLKWESRTVTLTNQVVSYRYREVEGNFAALLIHGLGDSSSCWDAAFCAPSLERFTLIAPDLPGFGNSNKENLPDKCLDFFCDILHKLAEALLKKRTSY